MQTLDVGGFDCGPLFAPPRKRRAPVRPKGKEGVVHRAQTRRATPAWADMSKVNCFYRMARAITAVTGELWVVDHIVPKISPYVCGLHVEHNLRVIPAKENTAKANLWWPDMPEQQLELDLC